jgi:hypothetical protein
MPKNFPAGKFFRKADKCFGACTVNYSMAIIVEQSTVCAVLAFSRVGFDHLGSDVIRTSQVLQKWWSRALICLELVNLPI